MSAAGTCASTERSLTQSLRLACSVLASALAACIFLLAAITSFFTVLTMRGGSTVPGANAIFALAGVSGVLTAVCFSLVRRRRASTHAVWTIPLILVSFCALAFTPFAHNAGVLGSDRAATGLTLVTASALAAILALTQVSARLARTSTCSCS